MSSSTLTDYIDNLGFGLSQTETLIATGGISAADGGELLLVSSITRVVSNEWQLTGWERGWIVSVVFIGVGIGNILGGIIGDRWGRRKTIILAYATIYTLSSISIISRSWQILTIFRFLGGLSFGLGQPSVNALGGELVPSVHRLTMMCFTQFCFSMGEMITALLVTIDDIDMKDLHWRWLVCVASTPSLILGIYAYFYLLESPRWLIMEKNDVVAATEVVEKIREKNKYSRETGFFWLETKGSFFSEEKGEGSSKIVLNDRDSVDFTPEKDQTSIIWTEPIQLSLPDNANNIVSDDNESISLDKNETNRLKILRCFSSNYLLPTTVCCVSTFVMNFCFYGGLYAFPQVLSNLSEHLVVKPGISLILSTLFEIPGIMIAFALGVHFRRRGAMTTFVVIFTLFTGIFMSGVYLSPNVAIKNIYHSNVGPLNADQIIDSGDQSTTSSVPSVPNTFTGSTSADSKETDSVKVVSVDDNTDDTDRAQDDNTDDTLSSRSSPQSSGSKGNGRTASINSDYMNQGTEDPYSQSKSRLHGDTDSDTPGNQFRAAGLIDDSENNIDQSREEEEENSDGFDSSNVFFQARARSHRKRIQQNTIVDSDGEISEGDNDGFVDDKGKDGLMAMEENENDEDVDPKNTWNKKQQKHLRSEIINVNAVNKGKSVVNNGRSVNVVNNNGRSVLSTPPEKQSIFGYDYRSDFVDGKKTPTKKNTKNAQNRKKKQQKNQEKQKKNKNHYSIFASSFLQLEEEYQAEKLEKKLEDEVLGNMDSNENENDSTSTDEIINVEVPTIRDKRRATMDEDTNDRNDTNRNDITSDRNNTNRKDTHRRNSKKISINISTDISTNISIDSNIKQNRNTNISIDSNINQNRNTNISIDSNIKQNQNTTTTEVTTTEGTGTIGDTDSTEDFIPEILIEIGLLGNKAIVVFGFIILYLFTLESYPTTIRATGVAISMTFGRLGAIVCPLVYEGMDNVLYYFTLMIIGVWIIFLLFFFCPLVETAGKPLIEEGDIVRALSKLKNDEPYRRESLFRQVSNSRVSNPVEMRDGNRETQNSANTENSRLESVNLDTQTSGNTQG